MSGALNLDIQLADISVLSEEEKNKLLYEFNDTRREYPVDRIFQELFEEQVGKSPDNAAAVFEDIQLTCGELNERSNRLANVLRKKGVKAEDAVPIVIDHSIEMIVGIMGILKAGGAFLPVDPGIPEKRILSMLADSRAFLFLIGRPVLETYSPGSFPETTAREMIILDQTTGTTAGEPGHNPDHINQSGDLAYVIYTSGSTGQSKGVMIEHKSLNNLCHWHNTCYSITSRDLARWLPDGNIEFMGRIDQQVKIRGFRVEPGEIENLLSNHDGVKEVVVTAVEEPGAGAGDKLLCAYFVPDRGVTGTRLREYLAEELPRYMIPSYFVPLETIPVTANGKVDRKALPLPQWQRKDREYTPPRDKREEKLQEIWSEVLGIEKGQIGIDDNFFHLGGHSLKATLMLAKIHKAFNVNVELSELFKMPSIRSLTRYISGAAEDKYVSIEPAEKREYYSLSSAQERLYFLQHTDVKSTVYNMPLVTVLEGDVDKERLEDTIKKLVEMHESFGTSFEIIDEMPVQKIHDGVALAIEYFDLGENKEREFIRDFIRPFDLGKVPLLRVGLAKAGEAKYILIMDNHHIIMDGFSNNILMDDFMRLCRGRELPPLKLSYKDFSRWQNRESQKETVKEQEEYWLDQFKTGVPPLNLPTDYERPAVKSFAGNHIRFEMGKQVTGKLKILANEQNVTLYMLLLALYNVLLWKLSGNTDILVGVVIAGRRHAALQQVIGLFLNTLALRNYPSGEKKFVDFLKEVKEKTLKAFENQDYPFYELVKKIVSGRDASRNVLVDIGFSLQEETGTVNLLENPGFVEKSGFLIKPYRYENKLAKGDMIFHGMDTGDNLSFMVEYSSELFKEETISNFVTFFKTITTAILDIPGIKLKQIEVISKDEKERIFSGIQEKNKDINIEFDV